MRDRRDCMTESKFTETTLGIFWVTIICATAFVIACLFSGLRQETSESPQEPVVANVEASVKISMAEPLVRLQEPEEPCRTCLEEAAKVIFETSEPEPVEAIEYYNVPLSEDLQNHIFALCEESGLDPAIVIAMIKTESNFKSDALGDGGNSKGLMQIQQRFHQARMDDLGCPDLLDPYQNVTVGIDLLGELYEEGRGLEWALMVYNGGPAHANRNARLGTVSTYVTKVMETSESLGRYEK